MPPEALDWMQHHFAFRSADEARLSTASCYRISPEDDDVEEMSNAVTALLIVYEIYRATMAHAERGLPVIKEEPRDEMDSDHSKTTHCSVQTQANAEASPRSPPLDGTDPTIWTAFQRDQENNIRNILTDKLNKTYAEAERRSWIMVDEVFSIHLHGARKPNFFGSSEQWVLKCSDRLDKVIKAVQDHPVIAVDILRGRNLPEIAAMTDSFVEKRVRLQYRTFLAED